MSEAPLTTLSYALLGLLHQQPRSGYDLRKVFATTPMGHYSGSPGAIYPALRRLEERRLVTGEVENSESLRPRQVFEPTKAGTAALREWIARGIQRDDVIWRMDELMLRFAFQWLLRSSAASRKFLRDYLAEVDSYLKELREQLNAMPADTPVHGRLALESGVEVYQAHRRWARKALSEFEEKER